MAQLRCLLQHRLLPQCFLFAIAVVLISGCRDVSTPPRSTDSDSASPAEDDLTRAAPVSERGNSKNADADANNADVNKADAGSPDVDNPDAGNPDDGNTEATLESASAPSEPDSDSTQPAEAVEPIEWGDPERFILFAPGGPLVVQLRLAIDGKPYRRAMEQLIDTVLAEADSDGDGQPTWDELTHNPRFTYGDYGNLPVNNDQERARLVRLYDVNRNGKVDRNEVPRLVTRNRGGARAFSLQSSNYYRGYNRYESPTRRLLDEDQDGLISADEAEDAPARILSRDTDGDERLFPAEFHGAAQLADREMPRRRRSGPDTAVLVSSSTRWSTVRYWLEELYRVDGQLGPKSFPLVPTLFATFDRNGDGDLADQEIAELAKMDPQLELEIAFGRTDKDQESTGTVRVASLAEAWGPLDDVVVQQTSMAALTLPGVEIEFLVNDFVGQRDEAAQAEMLLTQYDTNRDGYLVREEADRAPGTMLGSFEALDRNGDGQVPKEEVVESLKRQQAAVNGQIRARVEDQPDALFFALDADNNGWLHPREVRAASSRLKAMDLDGDGAIHSREIPESIAVAISRGDSPMASTTLVRPVRGNVSDENGSPSWFQAMDVNADGDISVREFLGDAQQFEALDTDGDRFIDAQESQQAGGSVGK